MAKKKVQNGRIFVRMDNAIKEKMRDHAQQQGMDLSTFIRVHAIKAMKYEKQQTRKAAL